VVVAEVAVVEDLHNPKFMFTITSTTVVVVIIMEEMVVEVPGATPPHRIKMQVVEVMLVVIPRCRIQMLGQAVEAMVVIPRHRIQMQAQAVEVM
jgi:hypothetical protein